MPDRVAISRVAKILARATSSEPAEAAVALQSAYKRMVRDGVTLTDLLTLPLEELYQESLVRLVDVILSDQPDLSPSSRREAYAEYMARIVRKFSGEGEAEASARDASAKSRDDEAREYEHRRQQEEARRGNHQSQESAKRSNGNEFYRQNGNTANADSVPPNTDSAHVWDGIKGQIKAAFAHGSLLRAMIYDPVRGGRLLLASVLWGAGFAMFLLLALAAIHAVAGMAPVLDVRLRSAFAFLTALGTVWKIRSFHLLGYFR